MTELPDNRLHLMITSPLYNVRKPYDTDLSLTEYLSLLKSVFQETHRILVHGGRACINVANLGRKPYIPLYQQQIYYLPRLTAAFARPKNFSTHLTNISTPRPRTVSSKSKWG